MNYGQNIIYSLFTIFDRKIHNVHTLLKFRPAELQTADPNVNKSTNIL